MINKGKKAHPIKCIVSGVEGIGKSTFASSLPNPVFLDMEDGTLNMEVDRFDKPTSAKGIYDAIEWFKNSEYQTIVVDTIDWCERVISDSMNKEYKKESIEDYGFGKGYVMLKERVSELLDTLNATGKHVVLLAHIHIKKFEEPDGAGSYDRYELKLSRQVAPLVKEWADLYLFANYKTRVIEKEGKNKAIGGQERVMYTSRTAAWDAKNRYGLKDVLPFEPKEILHLFSSSAKSTHVSTDLVLESTPQSIYEILNDKWIKAGKTYENKQSAFQWLGVDSIDFQWDELNETQVKKLLEKL